MGIRFHRIMEIECTGSDILAVTQQGEAVLMGNLTTNRSVVLYRFDENAIHQAAFSSTEDLSLTKRLVHTRKVGDSIVVYAANGVGRIVKGTLHANNSQ